MPISGISIRDDERYTTQQMRETQAVQKAEEQRQQEQAVKAGTPVEGAAVKSDTAALRQAQTSAGVRTQSTDYDAESVDETTNQMLLTKANSGAELSASELSELKDLDPVLYAQAVKAQEAREALRRQMAENPSRASQAVQAAIAKASGEDEDTQKVMVRSFQDEQRQFASKYDQTDIGPAH